jgi:hypothetical protein
MEPLKKQASSLRRPQADISKEMATGMVRFTGKAKENP